MTLLTGYAEVDPTATNHDFLVVSLTGNTVDQFKTNQLGFQQLVAKLASEFCNITKLQNYGEINASTVEINNVVQCPTEWDDSEYCLNINLSVPVNHSGVYELSTRHLRNMWATHTPSQLSELGLQDCEISSDSTILILWLCISGVLLILFLVILVIVMKTKFIENYIRRRQDILGSSNRSWPSQRRGKQLVPPVVRSGVSITKLQDAHLQNQYGYDRNYSADFGIQNLGYNPDMVAPNNNDKRLSQISSIVDDFDSEDETIYPSSPLPQPEQRNSRSCGQLETTF